MVPEDHKLVLDVNSPERVVVLSEMDKGPGVSHDEYACDPESSPDRAEPKSEGIGSDVLMDKRSKSPCKGSGDNGSTVSSH